MTASSPSGHLIRFGMECPKAALALAAVFTVFFGLQFPKIKIDTDPENMLEATQEDRVFYDKVKERFGVHDLLVLGITDEKGILRAETLGKLSRIASALLQDQRRHHRRRGRTLRFKQRDFRRRGSAGGQAGLRRAEYVDKDKGHKGVKS